MSVINSHNLTALDSRDHHIPSRFLKTANRDEFRIRSFPTLDYTKKQNKKTYRNSIALF